MTAHRTQAWLGEAVESLLCQSLPSGWRLEVMIGVDKCPGALAAALLFAEDSRVRVVEFSKNAGTYLCLNKLAELSTGELLAILDSDDISKPDRLRRQISRFLQQDIDFVAGHYDVSTSQGMQVGKPCPPKPTLHKIGYPLHSTWCLRKSLFQKLGGYRGWRCGADTDFWIRVLAYGARVEIDSHVVSTHRKRAGQLTAPGTPTGPQSAPRKKAQHAVAASLAKYRNGARVDVASNKRNSVRQVYGAPPRVVVLLPSIPSRERTSQLVVRNLLSQGVDLIVLHLNGYKAVPKWASSSSISARLHPAGTGPLVRWSEVPEADYVLGVDDDLIYPPDYVDTMVEHLRYLGHGAAISMHGTHWPRGEIALEKRVILAFSQANSGYTAKSYLGCGASGFHGSDLRRVKRDGPQMFDRLDDVWMSSAVARERIRLYRPPSARFWIKAYPEQHEGIFANEQREKFRSRKAAIAAALKLGGWKLSPRHSSL